MLVHGMWQRQVLDIPYIVPGQYAHHRKRLSIDRRVEGEASLNCLDEGTWKYTTHTWNAV